MERPTGFDANTLMIQTLGWSAERWANLAHQSNGPRKEKLNARFNQDTIAWADALIALLDSKDAPRA